MHQEPCNGGTYKGPDCPSGHHDYYAPQQSLESLPDCPHCKFGTPSYHANKKAWICDDCSRVVNMPLPK